MEKLFDTTDINVAAFLYYHDKESFYKMETSKEGDKIIGRFYFTRYQKQMRLLKEWLSVKGFLLDEVN